MSEVVAVGLITAGSSLFGAAIGAFTTYKVSLRNAEANAAVAVRASEVELAKISAENERLGEQHREDERRNRQGTYHELVALVNELLWADRRRVNELMARWWFINGGIALFGPAAVVEKARPLSKVLAEGAAEPDEEWRQRAIAAARELVNAMRADVGADALPPHVEAS
jgi:hypothetical protein